MEIVKRKSLIGNVLSKNQPTWSIVHGLSRQTKESIRKVINVNCLNLVNSSRYEISTNMRPSSLHVSYPGTLLSREKVQEYLESR